MPKLQYLHLVFFSLVVLILLNSLSLYAGYQRRLLIHSAVSLSKMNVNNVSTMVGTYDSLSQEIAALRVSYDSLGAGLKRARLSYVTKLSQTDSLLIIQLMLLSARVDSLEAVLAVHVANLGGLR